MCLGMLYQQYFTTENNKENGAPNPVQTDECVLKLKQEKVLLLRSVVRMFFRTCIKGVGVIFVLP